MNTDTKPLRGPKYRSRAFQAYLLRQSPERAAEIMAGERTYNELIKDPGSMQAAAERCYQEIMEVAQPGPAEGGESRLALKPDHSWGA